MNQENINNTAPVTEKESFGAKFKEWGRKQIVALKRKPQNIAFLFFAITSVMYLFCLNIVSPGPVKDFSRQAWLGLCIFVNALFSILVLVLFMNAFPKHKKVNAKTGKKSSINIVMLVLVFVFLAAMIFFDVLYYKQMLGAIEGNEVKFFSSLAEAEKYKDYWSAAYAENPTINLEGYRDYLLQSLSVCIAHIVLIGISAIALATLPLYAKLINMINTKKEIESTQMTEVIDTQD